MKESSSTPYALGAEATTSMDISNTLKDDIIFDLDQAHSCFDDDFERIVFRSMIGTNNTVNKLQQQPQQPEQPQQPSALNFEIASNESETTEIAASETVPSSIEEAKTAQALDRETLKRKRCKVLRDLTKVFNESNLDRLNIFLKARVDENCSIKTQSIAEPIIGKKYVMLFWSTLLKGIPDGVIRNERIRFNYVDDSVRAIFTYSGTKIYHRYADILFGRKLAEGALITDPESGSKWVPWPVSEVKMYLSQIHEPLETKDSIDIPGYFSANVEHITVYGTTVLHFNETDKITGFEHEWTFQRIERVGWGETDDRDGLSDY